MLGNKHIALRRMPDGGPKLHKQYVARNGRNKIPLTCVSGILLRPLRADYEGTWLFEAVSGDG